MRVSNPSPVDISSPDHHEMPALVKWLVRLCILWVVLILVSSVIHVFNPEWSETFVPGWEPVTGWIALGEAMAGPGLVLAGIGLWWQSRATMDQVKATDMQIKEFQYSVEEQRSANALRELEISRDLARLAVESMHNIETDMLIHYRTAKRLFLARLGLINPFGADEDVLRTRQKVLITDPQRLRKKAEELLYSFFHEIGADATNLKAMVEREELGLLGEYAADVVRVFEAETFIRIRERMKEGANKALPILAEGNEDLIAHAEKFIEPEIDGQLGELRERYFDPAL